MKFLLENQNKLSWLAGDWLQQDKDSMNVYSSGLSCNLSTASVRAALPVVEDILSNQPDIQFSLILSPELVFGNEELGSLEAFLTSGKMPPLPLDQMKKMISFLEETCGSRIQVAVQLHLNEHEKEMFSTLDKGEENKNEEEINDEQRNTRKEVEADWHINENLITISDSDESEDEDTLEIGDDDDNENEDKDQDAIIEVSVTNNKEIQNEFSDRGSDHRLTAAEQELVDVMKERNEAARRAGHSFNSLAGLPGNTATPRRYCRIINAKRPSPGCPGFKDTSRLVVCHVCEKKVNASYINRHLRRVHLLNAKEWKQIYGDFPST